MAGRDDLDTSAAFVQAGDRATRRDVYRATVGTGPIRRAYRTPEGLPLGDWVHKQYAAARRGRLSADRRRALEQRGLPVSRPSA
ncbi:helicase associated domain-containing protein [Amycolatopsis sp. Hca4]|uniref:helicase associated domain-containing protein n=1 Tax=Amycolatopsis sp. Hca4 TaxID=2742131 RepID=UPI0034CE726E